MNATFDIDFSRLNAQMLQLEAAIGREYGPQIVREEAKQFVKTIVFITPPKREGVGESAVDRSLNRVATPMTAKAVSKLVGNNPKLQKRVRQLLGTIMGSDREIMNDPIEAEIALRAIFKNLPAMRNWQKLEPSDFSPVHKQAQNQYGFVPRKLYNYTFKNFAWAQFVDRIRSHVGLLKAGWASAASALGVPLPSYVARHGNAWGKYAPDLYNSGGAIITMENDAVKLPRYEDRINDALKLRAQAMGTKLAALIRGKAVNLGFMTFGGASWSQKSEIDLPD